MPITSPPDSPLVIDYRRPASRPTRCYGYSTLIASIAAHLPIALLAALMRLLDDPFGLLFLIPLCVFTSIAATVVAFLYGVTQIFDHRSTGFNLAYVGTLISAGGLVFYAWVMFRHT